ncbi:MAG TPA: MazG-like family protein [Casimicrobiaceae bacterium]|nr:MazG-like family protein [Casimicrobiaceae bacterium]
MLSETTLNALLAFRRERDWEQFHAPRNLAADISVEPAELLETFVWAADNDLGELTRVRRARILDEIADIVILVSYLVHDLSVDLEAAVKTKLLNNASRYPKRQEGAIRSIKACDCLGQKPPFQRVDCPRSHSQMKIVVYVDGELLAAARRLTGTSEAGAPVHRALEAFIERQSARRLAATGGSQPQMKRIPRRPRT